MNVADIRLGWTKSPSSDVKAVKLVLTVDGTETTSDVPPEVEEFQITLQAKQSAQFKIVTFDNEGLQSTSQTYSFVLGDLEAPAPASNLFHEILAIRDVPDPVPAP